LSTVSPAFTLGLNYWPRRKAMGWWANFDPAEVRDEFAVIKEVGLNLVRIFLLWEDWQPAPDTVNPVAFRHLETVADIAANLGLHLDVTFFTGHMSGPNWAPPWLLRPAEPMPAHVNQVISGGRVVNCGYANPFTDPVALRAEELLLTTVVDRFKDHPAIGLWNLGNEPDLFAHPPSAAVGRAWANRMAGLVRRLDPRRPVTCGLHTESLITDNGLRVNDIFAEVDVAVMHGYPMYAAWAAGPLDPQFVPFLAALTTALCGKPTLMEEFGACTEAPGKPSAVWEWTAFGRPRQQFMASEEAFADYLALVLPGLLEVGATGALLWCYADYAPELYHLPPCNEARHERFFGLVRLDGSLKPHADVIRRFAATQPVVQPARRTVALDISPADYYQAPLHHAKRLYEKFVNNL
jgi:endo-1,4-beta-mannosidase